MTDSAPLSGQHLIAFVGDDYEDLELWYPKLRVEEAGMSVLLAGPKADVVYHGKHGYPCKSQVSIDSLTAETIGSASGVLCAGGWMPDKLRRDEKVREVIRSMHGRGRLIAAICHGGWMPISAGVYKGVQVTGSPGIREDLINAGAIWNDEPLIVDRHFVSSRRPDDLPQFCIGMLDVLMKTSKPA